MKLTFESRRNWFLREYICYKIELFRKKFYEYLKLPPTRGALQFHLKRAFHQLRIWLTADKAQLDERDPNLYGWTLEKNKFVSWTVDASIAATNLAELISCNCEGIWLIFCMIVFIFIVKWLFPWTKIENIMHLPDGMSENC